MTVDETQRRAAGIVGLVYLFVLIPGVFAEFYVPAQLIDYDNARQTALSIMANERLFRLGIAANFIVFITDVILIAALYVVLKPVSRPLALVAAFWRLVETAVLIIVPLSDLYLLRILSGADYLQAFETDQLAALARLSISAHNSAYNLGLVLAGLGSTVFCYLWLKSRYIPRALAAFGVFASLLLGVCTFVSIIFPDFTKVVTVAFYGGPIFVFELVMGLWLVFKGIRPSGAAALDRTSGGSG